MPPIAEQEGQQPRPAAALPPPSASPAFLLIGLGRIVRDDVETTLRAHGSSLRQLSALGHLSRQPGLSYSELGRRAGITAQSMQATLRQLEELGAVERRTVPGRGRAAQLHLTSTGDELLRRGQHVICDADQRLLDDVPADQQEVLTALLLQAFTAAIHREHPSSGG
jgi:DNA-binding MarR family transcriptional regulator